MQSDGFFRSGSFALVAVVALVVMPPARSASPPMYLAVPLGSLGGVQSEGRAINRNGHTTGLAYLHNAGYHAFLATSDRMQGLGSPAGDASIGTAINVRDDVVLNSSVVLPGSTFVFPPPIVWYAFRYSNGTMQPVDPDSQAMVTGIKRPLCLYPTYLRY